FSKIMYQPQLKNQYIPTSDDYSIKCWVESVIGHELPYDDLYHSLKDGQILCTLINKEYNGHEPKERINIFLNAVQQLGIPSSDLFCVNDLIREENMNAHELNMGEMITKRALEQENQENKEDSIPGFGRHTLHQDKRLSCYDEDEEELTDMYDTKNSNTSSGDSGYGTHRPQTKQERQNAQDLFDSVLTPPASQTSSRKSSTTRLSSLFSTKSRKEPHYVKFQTWSNQQQQQQYKKLNTTDPILQPELIPVARRKSTNAINSLVLYDEDGHLLAKYKLGNVIGKGHFGTVYRALDLMSGRTVAVKQINLKASKKQDIEDMMQEARLLGSMIHPNIVKYEGFIQTEEHMNIVLEYVENGSLLNTLKSFGNSLPEHLVASYCQRILKGLMYLHQQQVVHCDLKAANILTTKAGDVKLSDFGVSLNLKLKKDENIVSGTPFWMSPEVIELKGASIKSDIWSLGCTLIELCTGKPPYSDCIAMTAMFKIVEEECPPIPDNISSELGNFLELCFKKNPSERPSAQELLRHPWIKQHRKTLDVSSTTSSPSILMKKAGANPSRSVKSKSTAVATPGESSFAKKAQQKKTPGNLTTRQSMPVVSNDHVKPRRDKHIHDLIDCSFPKGAGTCKVCNLAIKRNAFMCKDFCGYICHKQCKPVNSKEILSVEPKPGASVSTQLREKFSISRLMSRSPQESSSKNPWWKKKSQNKVH
ncbi:hypothetical protein CU098_009991, partial [Rhizopus stolonifer]